MDTNCVKIELNDILDELANNKLRQTLIQNNSINVLEFESKSELISKIANLRQELVFANKCMNILNEYKKYFNRFRHLFEHILDVKQRKYLFQLESKYQKIVQKINSKNSFDENIESKTKFNLIKEKFDSKDIDNNEDNESNDENCNTNNENTLKFAKQSNYRSFSSFNCDFQTNCENLLERHEFDSKESQLSCIYCNFDFDSITQMRTHFQSYHSDIDLQLKTIICLYPECSEEFLEKNNKFMAHMRQHLHKLKIESFKCSQIECSFETLDFNQFKEHSEEHSDEKLIKCDYNDCDLWFASEEQLSDHTLLSHKQKPLFLCDICQQMFNTCEELSRHSLRKHTKEKPFKCEYKKCLFQSFYEKELIKHKSNHQFKHQFDCSICHKKYRSKIALDFHLKSMHSNNSIVCRICGKKFNKESVLALHMEALHSVDADPNNIKCNTCRQKFKTFQNLRQHMSLHSNENKFSCKYIGCELKFKTNVQRSKHVLVDHKKIVKWYSCDWPSCDFKAKAKIILINHKCVHTGEKNHHCSWPECGKSFRQYQGLSDHMRMHTKDLKYVCDWPGCSARYYDRGNFRKHKLKHKKQLELFEQSD